MHAIRAAHAFDGDRFLPGGATVLVDGDRIVAVETDRDRLPADVRVTEYDGTVLPGLIDCHTHLVADATVGGLERTGAMSDEEIDTVIVASDDGPRPRRHRLPHARVPRSAGPAPCRRVGTADHHPGRPLPLPRRGGRRRTRR